MKNSPPTLQARVENVTPTSSNFSKLTKYVNSNDTQSLLLMSPKRNSVNLRNETFRGSKAVEDDLSEYTQLAERMCHEQRDYTRTVLDSIKYD